MSNLLRSHAPFSAAVWAEIDEEATRVLKTTLAARKLIDFEGPLGWETAAVPLGRTDPVDQGRSDPVKARLRRVQPLVELRVPFTLSRDELDMIERGAKDPDLGPVTDAAQALARAEDRTIFHGMPGAGITGIMTAAADRKLSLSADYQEYVAVVVEALSQLKLAGISGPYGVALGPRCYEGLNKTTTPAGFPVLDHVRNLIDGPIVWAPAVDGAVVLSVRGGDFQMTVGQDISIGYVSHDSDTVTLFLEESLTFRVLAPEAAVPLVYA